MSYWKEELIDQLAVLMGGRVAEEVFVGDVSSGAKQDFERATQIARRMVCNYGMSEKLGPLNFGQGEHEVFLGKNFSQRRDFSDDTARMIDAEVHDIVMHNFNKAKSIIQEKREILVNLAEALLLRETLDADDVITIMTGEILPPKERVSDVKAANIVSDKEDDHSTKIEPKTTDQV